MEKIMITIVTDWPASSAFIAGVLYLIWVW